jgi:hypothetical protein
VPETRVTRASHQVDHFGRRTARDHEAGVQPLRSDEEISSRRADKPIDGTVDNVDLRLLDRFRIAQRLNRGGTGELHALDELRARIEEHRRPGASATTRVADVIRLPTRA